MRSRVDDTLFDGSGFTSLSRLSQISTSRGHISLVDEAPEAQEEPIVNAHVYSYL